MRGVPLYFDVLIFRLPDRTSTEARLSLLDGVDVRSLTGFGRLVRLSRLGRRTSLKTHRTLIPCFTESFFMKHNIFTFLINSRYWDGAGYWNPPSWETRTYMVCWTVNIMVADCLWTNWGARSSAVMKLTDQPTLFFIIIFHKEWGNYRSTTI